jgi:hypothetical protein
MLRVWVACSTAPKGQVVQSIPADSTEYFRTQVQQISTVSATKDSLFREPLNELGWATLIADVLRKQMRWPIFH